MRTRDTLKFYESAAARLRSEVHAPTTWTFSCPRCREEVAPGAMWCTHCGFDLTTSETVERRARFRGGDYLPIRELGPTFLEGAVLAIAFTIIDIVLEHTDFSASIVVALLTLIVALFLMAGEMSVASLARMMPLILAAFLLTMF